MGNLKGSGVMTTLDLLHQRTTPGQFDQIKAGLSEDDRRTLFGKPVLPVSWVDFGAYMRWVTLADRVIGTGDLSFIREAARYAAQQNLKGIYKFFVSLVSPEFTVSKSPRIWKQYYDEGELSVLLNELRHAQLKLTGWPTIPLNHELNHETFSLEALKLAGGKNPRATHPYCMARGDAYCLFDFIWE